MIGALQKQTKTLKDDCQAYLKSLRSYDHIDDRDSLIAIIETMNTIRGRADDISLTVERADSCYDHLKEEGVVVTQMVKNLRAAEEMWEDVLTQMPITEKAIVPITAKMAEKTEFEMEKYCKKFEQQPETLRARLR